MKRTTLALVLTFFTFTSVFSQDSQDIAELPIEIVKAGNEKDVLIIYITGDGGWNKFSQEISQSFADSGYTVLALNSRKYFWDAKKPERFSADVEKLITHYLNSLKKSKCIIVGYSFGADVAAFLPLNLTKPIASKITLLALLSPSASTDFEIKLSDLMGGNDSNDRTYKVGNAIEKTTLPVLCLFGKDEDLILKKELKNGKLIQIEVLPGSHRYNQESELLVKLILSSHTKY